MPRLVRTVPKYLRHCGSKQAVVTLSGRDHYLGPYGTKASHVEYDRLISEWLAGGRQSSADNPNGLTVVELCALYFQYAKTYYRGNPKLLPGIKQAIRLLLHRYELSQATDLGPLALKALRRQMIEQGLSRTYINDHVGRIQRIFKWAVGEQLLPVAVHQALVAVPALRRGRSGARETEPVRPIDDATVDATLTYLPEVVRDMVCIQRLTGCRPCELCAIRPIDIDRTVEIWEYRPTHHKTEHFGKSRVIFIGPKSQAILRCYLVCDAESFCFRPCDSELKRRSARHARRNTPLSSGNRPGTNRRRKPQRAPGEAYDVDAYRRAIHRACDKAFPPVGGLAQRDGETLNQWYNRLTEQQRQELAVWRSSHRWSPNRLRHSAGTEIRKRFGLEAAQVALGHAMADTTQVYAERDYALAARVAREVG
jgi:integrase